MPAKVTLLKKKNVSEAIDLFVATIPPGSSRKSYSTDLHIFYDFLSEQGLADIGTHEVETEHIASFRDRETERVSSASLRRRLCTLRSFFSWAVSQGHTDNNPASIIPLPKKKNSHPVILSTQEIERLLAAPDPRKPMGARDRAMLSICYYAGLRISELCSLKTDSLRWEHFKYQKRLRPAVVVEGKGGRTRAVPLSDSAVDNIKGWLEVRPGVKTEALFLLRTGEPMTQDAFRYLLKKYAYKAGIQKFITPHSLRHGFASHLAQGNVRLDLISDYLGHADLSTTKIYLHLSDEEYAQGVDALPSRIKRGARMM